MRFGWKIRVGLVCSAIWLCLAYALADDYQRQSQVLAIGVLPLLLIWGIIWTIDGWRAQHPRIKTIKSDENFSELHLNRRTLIHTALTVTVIFILGLCVAVLQFHFSLNKASGNVVFIWFGRWLVYGLIAYAILRAIPTLSRGAPAILASLLIIGAVNYKAYSSIAEGRQTLESLARAAPLLSKIQSGVTVNDQEVRDAHIGMMEPLMLSQAAYSRDFTVIAAEYTKATQALQLEQMLTPRSLANSSTRAQTRIKLKVWSQTTEDYKNHLDAAIARGKLGFQASLSQLPTSLAGSASKGLEQSFVNTSTFINMLITSEREANAAVIEVLNLLDANPGGYVFDSGPPENLLFRKEATLARYRQLVNSIVQASQREKEAQSYLINVQTETTNRLSKLFTDDSRDQ